MNTYDSFDYIDTTNSGFDYPSEAKSNDNNYETVSKWLDDFGWV